MFSYKLPLPHCAAERVNFIILNSKMSETRFWDLNELSSDHTALNTNLCILTTNPLFLLPYYATAHLSSLINF